MQTQGLSAYQFEFRPYQRLFKRALSTSYGNWAVREGVILRLTDETGRVSWGEIAPIPWFGSETLEQALDFCQQLPQEITTEMIFSIPAELPACQFGFESAWEWGMGSGEWGMGNGEWGVGNGERDMENLRCGEGESSLFRVSPRLLTKAQSVSASSSSSTPYSHLSPKSQLSFSHLLPTGEAALQAWQTPWNQGSRTFKWKIGVASIEEELKIFNQLIQALPQSAQLRLDANGGLIRQEANQWLQAAEEAGIVEFLEQPLPPEQFDAMLEMSVQYSTPVALDESVATLDQLEDCYQRGWRGIFAIKAAIAGSPKRLRQFCQDYKIDAVFSSVFESAIARRAALQLATELSNPKRAVGFGVNHWFLEDDVTWLEHLWNEY